MFSLSDQLLCFDVANAHCYDPNEEARLRKVIDALGTSKFNDKIHDLGEALKGRRRKQSLLSKVLALKVSQQKLAAGKKNGSTASMSESDTSVDGMVPQPDQICETAAERYSTFEL